jgi:TonB family protein
MNRPVWAMLFTAALAAGCESAPVKKDAAVVQDPEAMQLVKIEAISAAGPVAGARCGVKNDKGGSEIVTPGVAEVLRSARPLEILCFMPGYRVAIQSIDSTGDIIGPAATGAVVGGGLSAIAALPLLTIPIMGPFMYAGAVGGSALLGGTINAADKHVKGKIYSYPPALLVTMIAYDTPNAPAFQIAAARPAVSDAIVQPAPLESPATMQPVAPPSARPGPAAPLVAATPPPAMMLASFGTPRSVEAPVVPLFHVIPEFPDEAAKAGVGAGRVRAQLEIDADGNVAAVRIIEAQPGRVFDGAVTDTLAKWKFARGAPDRRFEAEIEFRR